MPVELKFCGSLKPCDPSNCPVVVLGQLKHLQKVSFEEIKEKFGNRVTAETYKAAVNNLHPSPTDTCSLWLTSATVAALPSKCSRHNTPSQGHQLSKIVKNCSSGGNECFVIVCERSEMFASACAAARPFPLWTRKSNASTKQFTVYIEFLLVGPGSEQPVTSEELECMTSAARGIRLSAKICDMPCSEMHVDAFLNEITNVADELGVVKTVFQGQKLKEKGFGGIWAVGRMSVHQPALAVLSHTPPGASKTVAWVGKGIVFDQGGLCIKTKTGMCGMKRDCGGAATVLGAFYAAVKEGFKDNLHAVFCLAENAIGPDSFRPDDIITMYSGRTVEINNTDAEGRLVLGDGVAYAQKDLKADVIVDLATLTGAQGIATGRYHGAVLTNREEWEVASVEAGKNSGDLIFPVPFTPELHFNEFSSAVADMKNSVADRSNAQVSCAGLFIMSHLGFDFPGSWIHVDMAYPVHVGERGTGYGVALLMTLFGNVSKSSLLQSVAPPIAQNENMVDGEETASKRMKINE